MSEFLIFEQMDESIAIYDSEARFVYANAAMLSHMGLTSELALGRCLWDIYPEARDNDFSRTLRRAIETKTRLDLEHFYAPWDRWFDNRFYPHPRGVCVIAHDITARRRAERAAEELRGEKEREQARLASLFETIPAAVAVVRAPEWTYELSNARNDALGRRGPLLGKRVSEVLPELERQGFVALLDHVRATGEPYLGTEVGVVVEDAEGPREVYLSGVYQPVRNAAGEVERVMAFAYDVTEQVRARKRMEDLAAQLAESEARARRLLESERRAREQAEAANLSKDQFLAMVSHELRTPLNAMLGWGRLLKAGTLDPARQARALDVIDRNAQAQAQLIEDLLDISRIVSGKLRLELSSFDPLSTIEAAVETLRPALESKRMTLSLSLPVACGSLWGDPHRLQQVLWNLLSNAVKFTPSGGELGLTLQQADGETQLTVSDTGKGIAPDVLPFVFDSFRQADSSITRAFGGLGLGLSISRHLIELHGGSIAAFSHGEGRGATFVVRLPSRAPGSGVTEAAPLKRPSVRAGVATESLARRRVLVVDDEPDTLELVSAILSRAGAHVVTAPSALVALELLASQRFDVLVSDIGMPEQDGYAFIRRIRAHASAVVSRIPAAALTAYARSEDGARAIAAGYQLHLAKPVDPQHLTDVVSSLSRMGQQLEA